MGKQHGASCQKPFEYFHQRLYAGEFLPFDGTRLLSWDSYRLGMSPETPDMFKVEGKLIVFVYSEIVY